MAIPNGGEIARPFLPTLDFEKSGTFYEALGFKKLLDESNNTEKKPSIP